MKLLDWRKAVEDRLGFCYYCGDEYDDLQVVIVDEEKTCPKCKQEDRRIFYFCVCGNDNPCESHA